MTRVKYAFVLWTFEDRWFFTWMNALTGRKLLPKNHPMEASAYVPAFEVEQEKLAELQRLLFRTFRIEFYKVLDF